MAPAPRVVVVGGGVAGLAAAHRLVELGRPVDLTLLEAGPRLGGNVRTVRTGGFVLDDGPDSFVTDKPWGLALVERLGLGARLRGTDPRHRRTYVVHRGRLHELPEGFLLLAPTRVWPVLRSSLFSWAGKARLGLDLVLPRGPADGDESLAAFVRRRLGREALERVAAPLVGGIHAARAERLSLVAALPRFRELEQRHRSLILGLRRSAAAAARAPGASARARFGVFATLAGGLEELVDALAARLPAGSVRLGTSAARLAPGGPGGGPGPAGPRWRVLTGSGEAIPADAVVLAGQAPRMAPLLEAVDPALGGLLAAIPYASSATVALAYPREAVGHPLDAHGFVVAPAEPLALRACTFTSVKYPGRAPDGAVLLRAYLGGAGQAEVLARDDAALAEGAHAELARLLAIRGDPHLVRLTRHAEALPQYEVGHPDRVRAIEARLAALPGLALAGAAYHGVGLADAIRHGEAAAEALLPAPGP
jgi:oxygen-dependent protoporphyrinogen oxidase